MPVDTFGHLTTKANRRVEVFSRPMLQQSVRSNDFVSDEEARAGNVLAHREDARTFEPVLVFLADVGLPVGLVGFGDRQHAQSQQTKGKAVARQELFVRQSLDDLIATPPMRLASRRSRDFR